MKNTTTEHLQGSELEVYASVQNRSEGMQLVKQHTVSHREHACCQEQEVRPGKGE